MPEFKCVGDGDCVRCFVEYSVATVVFESRPDVEPVMAAVIPRVALLCLAVDNNSAACRAHRRGIEVVRSEEVFLSGLAWFGRARSEKVESELCLREQEVPSISREVGCSACKDCKEVIFEGADGAFS